MFALKLGLLALMVLFIAVLIGLFVLSYKMLSKVRREERLQAKAKVEYQLHPKLKAEKEKQNSNQ